MKLTGKMRVPVRLKNRFSLPGTCLLVPRGKFFLLKKINTFMLNYSGEDVEPDEKIEL